MRSKKWLVPALLALLGFLTLAGVSFYYFPVMGHDFYLIFTWANDYHFAWQNFGVFNVLFTPQRCLGVPVWANPSMANFSLFHVLAAFLKDTHVVLAMLGIYSVAGFWGTRRLLGLFEVEENWKNYFSLGWVLQGFVVAHAIVGHLGFVTICLWPLYTYLLLRPEKNRKTTLLGLGLFGVLISHDFYLAMVYQYAMYPLSFLLLLLTLRYFDRTRDLRCPGVKFLGGMFVSIFIILPKALAVLSFVRNYQRSVHFALIRPWGSLEYALLSKVFPIPLDYQKMVGWNYGNWESTNYLYPGLVLIFFLTVCVRFRQHQKLAISTLVLLLLGAFITSGAYGGLVKHLPVVKSFHVNPRWLPILHIPLLYLLVRFVREIRLPRMILPLLILFNVGVSFLLLDRKSMYLTYQYGDAYNPETNRALTCYEPVFGYNLELFPWKEAKKGQWLDPRCYLSEKKCESMLLPEEKIPELLNYSLRPFDK